MWPLGKRPTCSPQSGMIVRYNVLDAAQAASLEALEEGAPMHLGFRQGHRDAEQPATLIWADPDCREHRSVAHDPAMAHLFIPGVEDQIFDLAQGPIAPCRQLVIEQLCSAADLAGGQALDSELAHHRFSFTDGNALHSDRGGHYRWPGWLERIDAAKLVRSMSRKASSQDNAASEGFFGRLKTEFFYPRDWRAFTAAQLIDEVDPYIRWYNERRIKMSLGGRSPIK